MNRVSLGFASVGAALVLFGCGGGTALAPPTVSNACAAYAARFCEDLHHCAPGLEAFVGFTSPADCQPFYEAGCLTLAAAPHSGFTAARIQRCANAAGTYTCPQFFSLKVDPSCRPAGGTVADGGSCVSDWQCASGRCSSIMNACGVCVARVARGAECDPGHDACADGLACSGTGPNSGSYVCTPVSELGGPCTDGAVCPGNARCDQPTQVCVALPKLGEACDSTTTPFCDPSGPAAACDLNVCVAGPVPAHRGDSCEPADAGASAGVSCLGNCVASADGGPRTCEDYVQAGQSCAQGETCAYGLACVKDVCATCDGSMVPAAAQRTLRIAPASSKLRGRLRPQW